MRTFPPAQGGYLKSRHTCHSQETWMNQWIRIYSAALALLFVSSPTMAQTNADSIRTRVKDGQKVSITDDQGQEFKGRRAPCG